MASYLIIGASGGIGKEIVQKLRKENHKIFTASRENRTQDPDFFSWDITGEVPSASLPDSLDGLVYCPGSITLKPWKTLRKEDFLRDWEINLWGAFQAVQALLPALQKSEQSSIVFFSTVAVQLGLPYHASIASAKGAVEGLTRSLAAELAPKVRVNAIAPSLTDTPLAGKLLDSDTKRKSGEDRHPLKKVGSASDLASLAVWLLSQESQFVTGQIWAVDGGLGSLKTN